MFRYSVLQAAREKVDADIQTLDEREELNIIPDYYDLNELLDEVIRENPWLSREGIESVGWSSVIVRRWFGLCQRWDLENGSIYDIQINRMLSSPQIDREIIKYLLYHEMLHKSGYWEHDMAFREKEWAYPYSDEWDGILDSLALKYKLEIPLRNHPRELKAEPTEGQGIPESGPISPVQAVLAGDGGKSAVPEDKKEDQPVTAPIDSLEKPAGAPNLSGTQEVTPSSASHSHVPGVIAGYKYCRNCGNRLPESARFCDRCGMSTVYTGV